MSYQRNICSFNVLHIVVTSFIWCNRLQRFLISLCGCVLVCVSGLFLLSGEATAETGDVPTVYLVPRMARTNVFITSRPVAMPFYVHNNALNPPPRHFAASGYMGDVSDLRVMGAYTNLLQKGVPCIKVVYTGQGSSGWAGLAWQNPADNWGDKPRGGYNLTKARQLEFWARGERGGEVVEFKAGGAAGQFPDSTTLTIGSITLSNEWVRFVIDLHGEDLGYISTGFAFVLNSMDNPNGCVFYLDHIGYTD